MGSNTVNIEQHILQCLSNIRDSGIPFILETLASVSAKLDINPRGLLNTCRLDCLHCAKIWLSQVFQKELAPSICFAFDPPTSGQIISDPPACQDATFTFKYNPLP